MWILIGVVVLSLCGGIYWYLERSKAVSSRTGDQVQAPEHLLARARANKTLVARARQQYLAKCSQCHGVSGEGRIGPNLTDDYWLHGGTLKQIYEVIERGVPHRGMLAWGKLLARDELVSLTAYVASLRGTRPSNAKAPEGQRATR